MAPNTNHALTFNSAPVSLGNGTTNSSGSFQVVVTIPADATAGNHTITATDPNGRVVASVGLTVSGTTGSRGGLARTGANALAMLLLAGTAVLLGWFVLNQQQQFTRSRRW